MIAVPMISFVAFVVVSISVMLEPDQPQERTAVRQKADDLAARAAMFWAANKNSSHRTPVPLQQQATMTAVDSKPPNSPRPPNPILPPPPSSHAPPTLSPVITDAAECARPPNPADDIDVTLVTQASVERLWMIPHICARWGGRMVVVTLRQPGEAPIEWPPMAVGILRPEAASYTAAAAATATANSPSRCALLRLELTPPAASESSAEALGSGGGGGGKPGGYPINWLRNRGISCVATSHYFVVDVDFWPSAELLSLLRDQLHGWDDATALVVPNFQRSGHGCRNAESAAACREAYDRREIEMPATFAALRGCMDATDCVVFDGEYNPQGQASTDVASWLALNPGATRRVPCITSERYEPFVALRRSEATPSFDERFSGYGKNKVQLAVHLRKAGFAFAVLGRGFVTHFPHQRSASKHHWLHSSAHGRVDKLFATFGREVATRYAATAERTPLCSAEASTHSKRSRSGGGAGGAKPAKPSAAQRLNEERLRRQRAGELTLPTQEIELDVQEGM